MVSLITLVFALIATPSAYGSQSGDAAAGKSFYVKNCSGCHSTDPTINHYAPNLHCIVGRQAGSADFGGYSLDFKAVTKDLVWDEQLLSDYLRNQRDFVTTQLNSPDAQIMMNIPFADGNQRADVIAYLNSICE